MFVIINMGICCHYQIEGGVFTDRAKADAFADAIFAGQNYVKRDDLMVVEVEIDPTIDDFAVGLMGRDTSIWPGYKNKIRRTL